MVRVLLVLADVPFLEVDSIGADPRGVSSFNAASCELSHRGYRECEGEGRGNGKRGRGR